MELLKLTDISVIYGEENDSQTIALKNIHFALERGEFVTIQGKSGCGKTTLLNVIGGVMKPTYGKYAYEGEKKEIQRMSRLELTGFRRNHLGYVLQSFGLLDDMTVEENVELPLIYQKVAKKKRRTQVEEMLGKLDILELAAKKPYQLSGGQKQRVAIARAMVHHPDLLLADEPTGALDEENGKHIVSLLEQMNREGTTVVMVTHDQELASKGTRRIEMRDGKIVTES